MWYRRWCRSSGGEGGGLEEVGVVGRWMGGMDLEGGIENRGRRRVASRWFGGRSGRRGVSTSWSESSSRGLALEILGAFW